MEVKGIDVSRWQGTINWDKVKKTEIKFAIIKAGGSDAGFYTDHMFKTNYEACKRLGIPCGCYYFVGKNCKTYADGQADAIRFYNMIKGLKFEYPVFMDFEAPSTLNKQLNTDAVVAFCEYLEDKGYYVGVYASDVSGFHDRLDDSRLQPYDHWVAKYSTNKPKIVKSYGIWQYSSKGRVDGIQGNVDLDISYKDYPSIMVKAHLNGY